jgi:GDP-L-fucose synthase
MVMTESNYLKGEPEEGLKQYAMTKRMLLYGLMSYAKQYGHRYLYYVPSTIFGTGFDLTDSHFIFDLTKKIVNSVALGMKPVELWGDGSQIRDLIHIDDVIKMVMNTIGITENKVINLSSDNAYSINQFAQHINNCVERILGSQAKIEWITSEYVGTKQKHLVVNQMFKNFEFTDLETKIQEMVRYYIDTLTAKQKQQNNNKTNG